MKPPSPAAGSLLQLDPIAYFAMGGFALFFGLFFLAFVPVQELLFLCLPITFIPGVVGIVLGIRAWRHERLVLDFSNWIRSHRRIKMDDMAQRLGRTRFETEKLLGEAFERRLVRGVIDRATDEFVSGEATGQQLFVGRCPNCHGEFSQWYFPEERFKCPYCERTLDVPTTESRP